MALWEANLFLAQSWGRMGELVKSHEEIPPVPAESMPLHSHFHKLTLDRVQ